MRSAVMLVVMGLSRVAIAQVPTDTSFDLQLFQPSPHGDSFFSVESGNVPRSIDVRASLYLHYAHRPLQIVAADGSRIGGVVDHRFDAHILGAISLFDRLSIGLSIPMALYQGATLTGLTGVTTNVPPIAFGDIRLAPKVMILDQKRFHIDIAAMVSLTLPTGGESAFAGDRTVTFSPELIIGRRFGPLRLALNFNYLWRERSQLFNLSIGPEFGYRFGAGFDLHHFLKAVPVEIIGELFGRFSAVTPFRSIDQSPLEWLVGARYALSRMLWLQGGIGTGIVAGYGSPAVRAFLGVTFAPLMAKDPVEIPEKKPVDSDADGIVDLDDKCPNEAEDFDKFEDKDGCPELDNDKDGIPDTKDKCPNDDIENKDGFEDEDGCFDADNDKDGIFDANDKCKNVPEDKDGFQDDDGCPEGDNDGDGILDDKDKCPREPEIINNVDDFDGCPDQGQTLVVIKKESIEILEKVQFETNSHVVSKKSYPLLEQVASTLKNHAEIGKVRVEGHTDDVGDDAYNLKLSQKRADSVRDFLIKAGVASTRLQAVGYGETKPLMPNKTKRGKDINRRVAFTLLNE